MSAAADPRTDAPAPRVLASALEAFAEQGYHGTSMRDLAAGAGLSVPGLYHHYRSKQDVLMALVLAVMDDLLTRTRAALEAETRGPVERYDALVRALLRFHLERRTEAFVASSEIRSLDPENRTRYVALRDEQQQMIADAIAAGVEAGAFDVPHPEDTARAVATLCVGVATWYRPAGGLPPDELVERHLVLARRLVGA